MYTGSSHASSAPDLAQQSDVERQSTLEQSLEARRARITSRSDFRSGRQVRVYFARLRSDFRH
jgi:hypothetical protein